MFFAHGEKIYTPFAIRQPPAFLGIFSDMVGNVKTLEDRLDNSVRNANPRIKQVDLAKKLGVESQWVSKVKKGPYCARCKLLGWIWIW